MRIIAPRARFEPTSLAFRDSMSGIVHLSSLILSLYPYLHIYVAPCLGGDYYTLLVRSLSRRTSGTTLMTTLRCAGSGGEEQDGCC